MKKAGSVWNTKQWKFDDDYEKGDRDSSYAGIFGMKRSEELVKVERS
jgi:hypothetical protein